MAKPSPQPAAVWQHQPTVIALLNAYRATVDHGRGEVVLVAGSHASGRSGVLRAAAATLATDRRRPTLIAGRFGPDGYHPAAEPAVRQASGAVWRDRVAVAVQLAAPVVDATGMAPPLAAGLDVAGTLLGRHVDQHTRRSEQSAQQPAIRGPAELKRLLRAATKDGPVVCLLDDLDQAAVAYAWWTVFLDAFAGQLHVDRLPVLLAVTLQGPEQLGPPAADAAAALHVAHRLVTRGLARWLPVKPVPREAIEQWLAPCTPELADRLWQATEGAPDWLEHLWATWQTSGAVHRDKRGRWTLANPSRPGVLGGVDDVLWSWLSRLLGSDGPIDDQSLNNVRNLLAVAALEGRTFTADALAVALDRDPDDLIDELDNRLTRSAARQLGVVEDGGFVDPAPGASGGWPARALNRYTFVDPLHWRALDRYGHPDEPARKAACRRSADALALVYADREHQAAGVIARLYAAVGDQPRAFHYQRVADFSLETTTMLALARWVREQPTDTWQRADHLFGAQTLLHLGWQTFSRCPYPESLAILEAAARHAAAAGSVHIQADALYAAAQASMQMGQDEDAVRGTQQALALAEKAGDQLAIARYRHALGGLAYRTGDLPAARAHLSQALKAFRQKGYVEGIAAARRALSGLEFRQGHLDAARKHAAEAIKVSQKRGDSAGEAAAQIMLAQVEQAAGHVTATVHAATRALALADHSGNQNWSESAHELLGWTAEQQGNFADAGRHYNTARVIATRLGNEIAAAEAWAGQGRVLAATGQLHAAWRELRRALVVLQHLPPSSGESELWHDLAVVASRLGNPPLAWRLDQISLLIADDIYSPFYRARAITRLQRQTGQPLSADRLEAMIASAARYYGNDRGQSFLDRPHP